MTLPGALAGTLFAGSSKESFSSLLDVSLLHVWVSHQPKHWLTIHFLMPSGEVSCPRESTAFAGSLRLPYRCLGLKALSL